MWQLRCLGSDCAAILIQRRELGLASDVDILGFSSFGLEAIVRVTLGYLSLGRRLTYIRRHLAAWYSLDRAVRHSPTMENEAAVLRDAAADAQAVYTFVGWMLVIGALSLVAVQRRKLKSASLYDRRSKA